MDDFREKLSSFNKKLEEDPDNINILIDKAILLAHQGYITVPCPDDTSAIELFYKILRTDRWGDIDYSVESRNNWVGITEESLCFESIKRLVILDLMEEEFNLLGHLLSEAALVRFSEIKDWIVDNFSQLDAGVGFEIGVEDKIIMHVVINGEISFMINIFLYNWGYIKDDEVLYTCFIDRELCLADKMRLPNLIEGIKETIDINK